jgi:threonine/homoserine/homoserine lactone efflux protein
VVNSLLAAALLLCMAAITPGPNNLVVLRTAGHAGLRGALPAIAGIVCGGLLLLVVAALGAEAAFATYPPLRRWAGVLGALYLAWLGLSLCVLSIAPRYAAAMGPATLPAGTLGLVGFQFLNPKSWVIVLTVLAAMPIKDLRDYLPLAGLFVLIPTLCLLLWAVLGAWLARWLLRPAVRRGVDLVLGGLLVACACLLLFAS